MDDLTRPERIPYARLESKGLTVRRMAVRFLVLALALAAVDVALSRALPDPDFEADWRMPRALPTSQLTPAVEHVERSADGSEPVVVFFGASPTWGDAVSESRDTIPAAYQRISGADGARMRVYNLAANGQLLGDTYFIARRLAEDADLAIVQLTYHGFNQTWRDGATRRYPEIPALLGVPIDREVADALQTNPTHRPDVTGTVDRWLRARWRLFGARDVVAGAVLGATPEKRLFERWEMLVMPGFEGESERTASDMSFDELEPDQQMLAIDEFFAAGDFRTNAADSEVRMLERLAKDMAAAGTRVVFYVSPLNVEALESYELFDREQYEANIAPLREVALSYGHRFLDLNESKGDGEPPYPASAFADMNHTTARGSQLVAADLWPLTRDLIEVVP